MTNFDDTDLRGAQFHEVDLTDAQFQGANLTNVKMSDVWLVNVDIDGMFTSTRLLLPSGASIGCPTPSARCRVRFGAVPVPRSEVRGPTDPA